MTELELKELKEIGFDGFFPRNIGLNELIRTISEHIEVHARNVIDKNYQQLRSVGIMITLMKQLNTIEDKMLLTAKRN